MSRFSDRAGEVRSEAGRTWAIIVLLVLLAILSEHG
jgi:hypothetical protein